MRIGLYDPSPSKNDYVSFFFKSLEQYAALSPIKFRRITELAPTTGEIVIANADYFTPEIIRWFYGGNCKMVAFSCIDSASLANSFFQSPEMLLISRIFAVTGVQTTNTSNATVLNRDMTISAEPRQFTSDTAWGVFDHLRETGRLCSLPYIPWNRSRVPERKSFADKRPTILFRGGAHFLRVLAYYTALKKGIADPKSGFQISDYFHDDMNPQFRACDVCRSEWKKYREHYPLTAAFGDCTSPAPWGGDEGFDQPGRWNNRCPASFYWLAETFGVQDMSAVEKAMNYRHQAAEDHLLDISEARFYADSKWEFSINAAQRFWEAASVGTVNLLPRRTNDQVYFPEMRDGEHYLTFSDDFSDLSADIDKGAYQRIADNAYALWEKWIRPTHFPVNTNLLKHIFDLCTF